MIAKNVHLLRKNPDACGYLFPTINSYAVKFRNIAMTIEYNYLE